MIINGFLFACGIALFFLALSIVCFMLTIPFRIINYFEKKHEDEKKTKELIAKGADPKKFFVNGGVIYQKDDISEK